MKSLTLFVSLLLLCMSTVSFGQVGVLADIGLNKDIFYPPDQVEIWVRGSNPGLAMAVDVYLSILTPDGKELYGPEFGEMAHPWIPNVVLPQGLTMDWTPMCRYALPSIALPLATPGQYIASLWLCAAGTQDRLTLGSPQQFTIAPCDRKSWVNDNLVCSLELDQDGVWAGLLHGVEFIPYDNPIRTMWKGEDGVNSYRTYLFRGFEGDLSVGGMDIGISVRYPYGWRRMLNSPGTFAYTYGVHAAVTDRDGTLWLCHKWPSYMSNEGDLVRCRSNGFIEDHTQDVGGMARYVVMTNQGEACAIGKDGLYVYNGDSFDFHAIEQFATTATVLLNCAQGDMHGNVWMMVFVGWSPYLYKYDLNTNEMTVWGYGDTPIGNTVIDAMASDPMGNVWLAQRGSGLLEYDGTNFVAFPLKIMPTCIAVGFDNTIYCGTDGDGIQVLKNEVWISYKNPSPEIDNNYGFLVGLSDGRALAAYNYTLAPGYAALNEGVWKTSSGDWCSKTHLFGLSEGQTGLWAWSTLSNQAFHETESGWVDTTEGCTLKPFGVPICVLEDDQGNPYMLMSQTLIAFADGTWSTIDTPAPEGLFGYYGLWIDHDGNMYLYDTGPDSGVAIQRRGATGAWTRIDDTNQLPAKPQAMTVSESGLLYVCSKDKEGGWHLTVIDGDQATSYSLNELDILINGVQGVVSDLADRAWIIAQAPDLSGRIIVFDPASEAFSQIPWQSGLLPFRSFSNYAVENGGVDRSMSQLGTLWFGGTPVRLNLAPRTELLLDKAAYSAGDTMRVDAYFANQAGSIPIDWYAAVEDAQGNLFYWPSYTPVKTAALAGLLVPTDTALILHLDDITIPAGIAPGHYKWKTGFTRAGETMWLGLGFTATGEFDITAKP